jgi:beta-ketoacyl-acyl-carrier-protein synthase II
MNRARVVITGIGAITPLGTSCQEFWQGLVEGRSGIRRITQFDASNLPCQIAGEIPDFHPEDHMDRKLARRISRCAQIALAAAQEAVRDAGLPACLPDPERAGIAMGTGFGGIDIIQDSLYLYWEKGFERVNPFALPASILNLPAFVISQHFRCLGPNVTISTACATSTQAIGEGAELIRRGTADLVITGGTEAIVRDIAVAGFVNMRAMPLSYNDRPAQASRPFDLEREGFVLSEGCGIFVLERLEHALRRGTRIYCEVAGHASSSDGYHVAIPEPDAAGSIRCMRWALQDAGLPSSSVDYINAHGSGTPINDPLETRAIKAVFGDQAYRIPISSTKSMIGHAMGAAGALEAIACAQTIASGWIHPTINLDCPDPECDLDYVPLQARQAQVNVALSNSFGLGSQNACLVFKRYAD